VSSSFDAISRVVAAFERSDWTEIDVRAGDVRVHLATGSVTSGVATTLGTNDSSDTNDTNDTADTADTGPMAPEGAHVVAASSPGIFWRSPEPGAPHFADVGDTVDVGTTVCIVEVMKLMNHLKAGVAGTVVAVYGRNGEAVQQGEPLFAIAPIESAQ
jgi:acetyl-CoA carboxylase biotin carboxyl carrier protein